MIDLIKITDPYERKARLFPSMILLLPLIIIVYALYPRVFNLWSGIVGLLISLGVLQLFANLARDRGKRLEGKLFQEWGGMPSLRFFRYRDTIIPKPAKQRYHLILAQQTNIKPPIEKLELIHPQEADAIYISWSDYLRGKTRNKDEFPLVFKENINYGFRRNLLGIRFYCLLSGFVCLAIIIGNGYKFFEDPLTIPSTLISVFFAILTYLLIFLFVVNKKWVKVPADAYARQLIESLNV